MTVTTIRTDESFLFASFVAAKSHHGRDAFVSHDRFTADNENAPVTLCSVIYLVSVIGE